MVVETGVKKVGRKTSGRGSGGDYIERSERAKSPG